MADLTAIWLVSGRFGLGDRTGEHNLTPGDSFLYSVKDGMQLRAQPLELASGAGGGVQRAGRGRDGASGTGAGWSERDGGGV